MGRNTTDESVPFSSPSGTRACALNTPIRAALATHDAAVRLTDEQPVLNDALADDPNSM